MGLVHVQEVDALQPEVPEPHCQPIVAVFRIQLFKSSETFIAAQVGTYQRYRPIMVGLRMFADAPLGLATCCPPLSRWKKLKFMAGNASDLVEALPMTPDIIHAHFAIDAVFAIPIARAFGVPLVVTLHGFDVTTSRISLLMSGRSAWIVASLGMGRLQKAAARFLAVSNYIRDAAVGRGFPAERTIVSYLGINVDKIGFIPIGTGKTIAHVGRLVEKKGTADLIKAFALVTRDIPEARLEIIGDGPLRKELEVLSVQLGISASLTFRGSQPHARSLEIMAEARIVAVPSKTARNGDKEGLPTVILEASALGRPVIATRHSGIPEAVMDGVTGILVDEGDVEGLARALIRLLSHYEVAEQMGISARKFIESDHNAKILTKKLEIIYDEAVAIK
jgi:colanic acid/amylovoran biosynthesis glycosyltransferase